MTLKTFTSAVFALALVAMSALQASAASSLVLLVNSETGNLSLQNTTASALAIQEFTVLTTGTGVDGTPVSGRPSNLGWLFSGTNTLPPASFPSNNNVTLQNLNGRWSTSGAANVGSAVLSLTANPSWSGSDPKVGPAGSFWSLGNIAPIGMTQADLNSRFMTNGAAFGSYVFGKFLYQPQIGEIIVDDEPVPVWGPLTAGDVILTPVPEPSTYALAFAGLTLGGYVMRRRRKTA